MDKRADRHGNAFSAAHGLAMAATLVLTAGMPAAAAAATLVNRDDAAHTLIVTEGGQQVELPIGPGESIEFCPAGCFVTLPNGDREVLTGSERLEIEEGRGRIF